MWQQLLLLLRVLSDQLHSPTSACLAACTQQVHKPFNLSICPHSQDPTQEKVIGLTHPAYAALSACSLFPIRHNGWHDQLGLFSPKAELGQSRGKFVPLAQ